MRSLPLFVSMLCASAAFAEPPKAPPASSTERAVSELLNRELLAPLKRSESRRSRFSRAAPVAVQRRVRVLDAAALTDVRGRGFVRFAIDERRAWGEQAPWRKDSITGCAYLTERQLFVRHGDGYLPASSLLGKDGEERSDVCTPALVTASVDRTR